MKVKIILSVFIVPLILLGFFGFKTISGLIPFQKDFYFIFLCTVFIIAHSFFVKNWSFNRIDIILLLFTIYLCINNYDSIHQSASLLNSVYLFGFYLLLKQFLTKSQIALKTTSAILIICFSLYTLHGFLQNYDILLQASTLNKVSGYYNNPAPYAAILISLIGFPLAKLNLKSHDTNLNKWNKTIEYATLILILLGVATIVFTKSRAALMAIATSITFLFILKTDWIKQISTKLGLSSKKLFGIVGLAILMILFLLYLLRPDSAYGRLIIWKISLTEMFIEHPVFGHGIDAFQNHYMEYQAQYFKNNITSIGEKFSAANTPYAFNEFIKILIEQGIIGLLLFLAIIISTFYFGFKKLKETNNTINKEILIAAITSLISILVFSNFSYPFHDITSQVIFYSIIAIISSQLNPSLEFRTKPMSSLIYSFFILALAIFSLLKQHNTYEAYEIWSKNRSFDKKIESLESVMPFFNHQGMFYIDYADALYESDQKEKAIRFLEKGKSYTSNPSLYNKLGRYYDKGINNVKQATSAYNEVSYALPYKFSPKYKLLKMYERNGLKHLAYTTALEINEMPIKIDSETLQNMKNHAKKIIAENSKE